MTDNIVDLASHRKKKEDEEITLELNDYENLHQICTESANEMINNLYEDYDINIAKIEYSAEMIFFFEAYKGLVMKCVDQWHPFQDMAQQFMEDQGIVIEKYDGGYRFVLLPDDEEQEPANDG